MRALPIHRRLPAFEKPIDDDCITLRNRPPGYTRSSAIDDVRTAIDRSAGCIGKKYVAAERDSFWIDRTMSGAQSRPIGTGAKLAFARPINGDAGKHRLFASRHGSGQHKSKHKSYR